MRVQRRQTMKNPEMVRTLVDQSSVTDADEKRRNLVGKAIEQVLTTQEVHALQINVKEAVMVKLNGLPEATSDIERHFLDYVIVSKALVQTHVSDCLADQDDKDAETCTVPDAFLAQSDLGLKHTEKATEQRNTSSFEMNEERTHHSCVVSELSEAKEKLPEMPTSIDSLQHLDKKLLL